MNRFSSPEVTANTSAKKLFEKFSNLNNLKDFLPKEIEEFESSENSCSFKISKLPKMSLEIIEKIEHTLIKLKSKDSKISFLIYCQIKENTYKESCLVTLIAEMQLNFMMKMMVEKPLNQFLCSLSDQIKKI
jgi:sugar-specific transcriptional regulator TrmB